MPSFGYDRETGQIISQFAHVEQSINVIFTTFVGERVMLRHFGAISPTLLGRMLTPQNVMRYFTIITMALELWEPRFRITKVVPSASAEQVRLGFMGFVVQGAYRPMGHWGDMTEEGPIRSLTLNVAGVRGQSPFEVVS